MTGWMRMSLELPGLRIMVMSERRPWSGNSSGSRTSRASLKRRTLQGEGSYWSVRSGGGDSHDCSFESLRDRRTKAGDGADGSFGIR